ncbi:hypothetical protein ACTNDK_08705 [Collinsella sp. HCP3S3_B1]|uniref:hypothetical protein n=1 Tax=unclassified Collinsella TaxID=2637548 RepID=UPI003F8AAAB4
MEIDCEACLESTLQSYPLDLSQDNPGWSDPYIDLEVQIDFINDFTGESFFSWISVIDLKTAKNSVIFDKDARFVTGTVKILSQIDLAVSGPVLF